METQTLMTEGSIPGKMLKFTLPLFLGNLFQQLYNTADALIVGNLIGNTALASVSSCGSLIFLIISFFTGISMGAGVAISRYFGADDPEQMSRAVHTNIALNLAAGAILTVFGYLFAPVLLQWMGTTAEALPGATQYIRIFFLGSMGLTMYNAFRGIMQAVGDSKNPLKYLIISSVLNVILDIVFIGVFHAGVGGAALATILAQMASAVLCAIKLVRTNESHRVVPKNIRFHRSMVRLIISYGLPSGIQNSLIAIANVVVQSNINAFGTNAVSGCGAYSKIEGFAFLPITSFTVAISTFVSQNLGAGKTERARDGARFGIYSSVILSEIVGVLVCISAPVLIRAFTDVPEAIAFGVQKARICAVFYCMLAASHCFTAVLRGAGKAVIPMMVMLFVWSGFRMAFLAVMVPVYNSINVVNWVYPLTWTISTVILGIYYLKADWVHAFEKQ